MNREDLRIAIYGLQLDKIQPQKMKSITDTDLINTLDYNFGNDRLIQNNNIRNTNIFLE